MWGAHLAPLCARTHVCVGVGGCGCGGVGRVWVRDWFPSVGNVGFRASAQRGSQGSRCLPGPRAPARAKPAAP